LRFPDERHGLEDFRKFLSVFGTRAEPGHVTRLASLPDDLDLYAVWVRGDRRFTER